MPTPTIVIRRATPADRAAVIAVERKSTPTLQYLPQVFDQFVAEPTGEFMVATIDDEVVACGKFTPLPNGSAWLETLRVIPERQGLGIGKRFYERFFELAAAQGITTMRMYTGTRNAVSKGLAERFGFQPAATFRGMWLACEPAAPTPTPPAFAQVTDPTLATQLVMPHAATWHGFLVMNRTFYQITPALCADLATKGHIYATADQANVLVLGARFMPEQALHVGLFGGDAAACLAFAQQVGSQQGTGQLSCLLVAVATPLQAQLQEHGFRLEASEFIVMESRQA